METITPVQSSINFGGVAAGSFGPDITPVDTLPSFNGGIEIKQVPEDGLMSVSIEGDTDHFSIRDVYIMEWVMETVDPGELPPGHHGPLPKTKVLEVAYSSDGKSPVEVKQGQFILIRTAYAAGYTPGTFTATVIIEADTWNTIFVSLSLFIAEVKTYPSGILNIAQGGKANLPFNIQSVAGPAVDVHFEMSPTQLDTGLTLTPNNFTLQPQETQTVLLEFSADKNAPIGSEEVALDQYAFRRAGFFFTANITHAQVTINPLIPHKIFVPRRNSTITIPVSVQLNNGPAIDIAFNPFNLPADVDIVNTAFSGDKDDILNMQMHVGNAVLDEFNFFINWETQWGQTGSMGFFVVITEPETISLTTSVVTDTGIPLGGNVEIVLQSNGNYSFKGSMEASGFPSYDFGLQVFIKAADNIILTAFHSGNVYGTDTPGPRNNSWEENLSNTLIKNSWLSIRNNPAIQYQLHASMEGVLGSLWDVLKIGLETIAAFMIAGPTGAGLVLGNELLSAANITPPPGVIAGIAVLEGTIVIFGQGAILPATVAGLVTGVAVETLIKSRPIHDDEKDFARAIFGTTLDDMFNANKVWITNLSHDDGRKYTIPSFDGTILLNLNDAFDNPMQYPQNDQERANAGNDYTQPGSVFAHELTHACQIAANKFVPGMICNGSGTYTYHQPDGESNRLNNPQWANLSWEDDFTREQQAHIVDDWYGAFCNNFSNINDLKNNLNTEDALNDPAFRFIIKCRAGIF